MDGAGPDATAADAPAMVLVDAGADGGGVDASADGGGVDASADDGGVDAGAPDAGPWAPGCGDPVDYGDSYATTRITAGAGHLFAFRGTTVISVDLATERRGCLANLSCDPSNAIFSRAGEIVFVCSDGRVLGYDLRTGLEREIASSAVGTGPLVSVADVAGLFEAADGRLFVAASSEVLIIDPATGDRTVFSDATRGTGPWPTGYGPAPIAPLPGGDLLLVGVDEVARIDGATGDRTVRPSACGSGGSLIFPNDVITVPSGEHWGVWRYVPWYHGHAGTDTCAAIRSVDAAGVSRSRSGWEGLRPALADVGSGTPFIYPMDLTLADDGQVYVMDASLGAIVRVDPLSGARTVVGEASHRRGAGLAFADPNVIFRGSDGTLYVADFQTHQHSGHKAVIAVDPSTGDRRVVTGNFRGAGPFFDYYDEVVVGIAQPTAGSLLLQTDDSGARRILEVDLATGDRTEPPVVAFRDPARVAAPDGFFYRVSGTAIVRETSGADEPVADETRGAGPVLLQPRGIEALPDGTLLVTDERLNVVFRVDPATGDRTLFSGIGNY